jgi:hypothetical protein
VVISSSTQSFIVVGQLIGTNWKILRKWQSRRIQLQDGTNMQWAPVVWAKRRDALTKDVIDVVMEFWKNETRVNPNKRDIMKHYIMKNRWEEHAIHFFEKPQVHSSKFFQFDSFCNFLIFCFNLLHCLWLFMGLRSMVVKDTIVWKHMFTISSNWSFAHLRLSS